MSNTLVPLEGRAPKTYDRVTGIQVVRGGQLVGENLFSSIQNSYANLVYHPFASLFLFLAFFILLAEANTTAGPLEKIFKELFKVSTDPSVPPILANLAGVGAYVFSYLVKYKIFLAYALLMWVPYIAKPSSRHLFISVFLTLFVLVFTNLTYLQVILLSQFYYLFVMLRTPVHKFLILAGVACVFATAAFEKRSILVALSRLNTTLREPVSKP